MKDFKIYTKTQRFMSEFNMHVRVLKLDTLRVRNTNPSRKGAYVMSEKTEAEYDERLAADIERIAAAANANNPPPYTIAEYKELLIKIREATLMMKEEKAKLFIREIAQAIPIVAERLELTDDMKGMLILRMAWDRSFSK